MEERTFNISEAISNVISQKSIVVTGMPRGGTTLLGSLINGLENSYCISEPMAVEEQLHLSATPEEFLQRTKYYFNDQRKRILETGKAVNRVTKDGRPVTNYFRRVAKQSIVQDYIEAEEIVAVRDENFILAVKHNAHFLSVLPLLCKQTDIAIIGIIRHPIPTILSWRSLALPITNGRLPSGEKFWPELYEVTHSDRELLLKQVMIYELIVTRLLAFKKSLYLLSYESLVRNTGQVSSLLNQDYKEPITFTSRNKNLDYDWNEVEKIKTTLTKHAPESLALYPMDDLDAPPSFLKLL